MMKTGMGEKWAAAPNKYVHTQTQKLIRERMIEKIIYANSHQKAELITRTCSSFFFLIDSLDEHTISVVRRTARKVSARATNFSGFSDFYRLINL